MITHHFSKALDARVCLAMSRVHEDKDEAENLELRARLHAFDLGWISYHNEDQLSALLDGEPILVEEWSHGREEAEAYEALSERNGTSEYGSEAEWELLTQHEQSEEWEQFHDLCSLGIADEMYFYPVLSNIHMVGYVGH